MQKFKVGDRVRVRQWDDMVKEFGTSGFGIDTPRRFLEEMAWLCGETGTVIGAKKVSGTVQRLHINWDNDADGNDRKRWSYDNGMFELIDEPKNAVTDNPKIVITTDGRTTIAKLYNNKSLCELAIAQCSPEDKFDFNIGAKLAMDRLMGTVKDDTNAKAGADTINVGDKVRIVNDINNSDIYDMYDCWVTQHAPEYAVYYAYGAALTREEVDNEYFVLKKAEHGTNGSILCLISTSPNPAEYNKGEPCYLIAEKDLRKVAQ